MATETVDMDSRNLAACRKSKIQIPSPKEVRILQCTTWIILSPVSTSRQGFWRCRSLNCRNTGVWFHQIRLSCQQSAGRNEILRLSHFERRFWNKGRGEKTGRTQKHDWGSHKWKGRMCGSGNTVHSSMGTMLAGFGDRSLQHRRNKLCSQLGRKNKHGWWWRKSHRS